MAKVGKLIYTCGEDWTYFTGMPISDPAIGYITSTGKKIAVYGPLELNEARAHATVDEVRPFDDLRKATEKKKEKPTLADIIATLIEEDEPDEVHLPFNFPAGLAKKLEETGLKILAKNGFIFPERLIKTADEIQKIRKAQALNEVGFRRAEQVLAEAEIGKENTLYWQGDVLTSEILRCQMAMAMLGTGAFPTFPSGEAIVGCGAASADVHSKGTGPLKAHEFIIIDSFPRHPNQYCGDLTRTYLKGTPTPWHTDVYNAVLKAQQTAIDLIQESANGMDIHTAVAQTFKDAGFETGISDIGEHYGYFHGTGHSLGLAVHDGGASMLTRISCPLKAGYITTVEPGLYYPPGTHTGGAGGCRIEDIVAVTKDGHENLTTLPKDTWVIG